MIPVGKLRPGKAEGSRGAGPQGSSGGSGYSAWPQHGAAVDGGAAGLSEMGAQGSGRGSEPGCPRLRVLKLLTPCLFSLPPAAVSGLLTEDSGARFILYFLKIVPAQSFQFP